MMPPIKSHQRITQVSIERNEPKPFEPLEPIEPSPKSLFFGAPYDEYHQTSFPCDPHRVCPLADAKP